MNPLPPNADELVSAYLDAEATPDEIAIVESNVELMARVESMRALSAQLGAPITPPAAQKEAHIAAALGAFDELFAETDTTTSVPAASTAPGIHAVPDRPVPGSASVSQSPLANQNGSSNSTVTSFEAARERRRPQRFSMGVIAAAAAALLLIVGFSALSLSRSSTQDSVATASLAVEASTDAASDTSEDSAGAADDAMAEDEEAMTEADSVERSAGGLSDAGSTANAAPAPTPPPPAAASEPQAEMDDDAAGDAVEEEVAMDEAADDEEPAEFSGADLETTPFYFGEFETVDDLLGQLVALSVDDLQARKAGVGQGIFDRCQAQIPELAATETTTLIGDAEIAGNPREVHVVTAVGNVAVFYIVDPVDCSTVAVIE